MRDHTEASRDQTMGDFLVFVGIPGKTPDQTSRRRLEKQTAHTEQPKTEIDKTRMRRK